MMIRPIFTHIIRLFIGVLALFSLPIFAEAKPPLQTLPFDKMKHFQVSLENGLFAVYRRKDKVYTAGHKGNFYINSEYFEAAVEQDLGFGTIHNPTDKSEKIPFPDPKIERRIRGIVPLGSWLFFLDSGKRQFLLWNQEKKIWPRPSDLVLDFIKPPSDPRGEPTRLEIAGLRNRFAAAYSKVQFDPELLAGLSPIPEFWRDRDGSQFLMLIRLPGSPLLTVRCNGTNMGNCQAMRACFVHGLPRNVVEESSGLAVDSIRQEILIGSPGERRIRRFKAPSCYHIAHLKEEFDIGLPEQLKDLSSLFVDSDNNLWLTTSRPDIYKSASVFRFDLAVWALSKP
jgi:hypothetical protein